MTPDPQQTILIGSDDPPPVRVVNSSGTTPLLLVCDHASNYIPPHLQCLGLSPHQLHEHIAWDIGAADLTLQLAMRLNCPAVLANYSRLLIDVNRDPDSDDPSLIPILSDGAEIPGNQQLSAQARLLRIEQLHQPYHHELHCLLEQLCLLVDAPALFSIHTFTPTLKHADQPRPWHAGMLWNCDPRMAVPLINYLRTHDHLVIGDNQPYSGREIAYTANRHGHDRGFPHCAIEIRQDLLQSYEDTQEWSDRLYAGLRQVLKTPGLHRVQYFDQPPA